MNITKERKEVFGMDKEQDFDIILECLRWYVSEFGIRMTEKELITYRKYIPVEDK